MPRLVRTSLGFYISLKRDVSSLRRNLTTNPIKHSKEGKEAYHYYWTTHFPAHDPVPYPTLISGAHPTAPLHNLMARWHCTKHDYASKAWSTAVKRKGDPLAPPPPSDEENRAVFDEIRKRRTAALKLYRKLERLEAEYYLRGLEHSPQRVLKRPGSSARPAVTGELARFLKQPEYRHRWCLQNLEKNETPSMIVDETSTAKKQAEDGVLQLVKSYRFDKLDIASNFIRLGCRVMKLHDHHPQLLMQFLPEARMFEVKISTWTHTPRELPEPNTVAAPIDPLTFDTDFDRVTQVNQYKQTVVSDDQPKIKKTVPSTPGLTRKDFLLAWELDAAENEARMRTSTLKHRNEKWKVKVAGRTAKAENLADTVSAIAMIGDP